MKSSRLSQSGRVVPELGYCLPQTLPINSEDLNDRPPLLSPFSSLYAPTPTAHCSGFLPLLSSSLSNNYPFFLPPPPPPLLFVSQRLSHLITRFELLESLQRFLSNALKAYKVSDFGDTKADEAGKVGRSGKLHSRWPGVTSTSANCESWKVQTSFLRMNNHQAFYNSSSPSGLPYRDLPW